MKRHRSLQFWARVRAVNWVLGGVGLVLALFSMLIHQAAEQRRQQEWVAEQRERRERQKWPERTISRLAFSPDGRTLVGQGKWIQPGVRLGEMRAWDVRTGKRLWSEVRPIPTFLPATFLPGGQSVVSVCADSDPLRSRRPAAQDYWPGADVRISLRFRDTRSGRIISNSAPLDPVAREKPTSIDISPDGRAIAVAFPNGVALWDAPAEADEAWHPRWLSLPPRDTVRAEVERPVASARFTPDRRFLVVLLANRSNSYAMRLTSVAEVWDTRTGARVRSFDESLPLSGRKTSSTSGTYAHLRAALSPDRQRIATLTRPYGTSRISLALWEVKTGRLLRRSDPDMLSGSPGDVPFDSLEFLTWHGGKPGPSLLSNGGVSPHGHDVVALMAADPGAGNVVRNPAFRRYWMPGLNRLEQVPPKGAFVPRENAPISPDGRLRARPGGPRRAPSVRLYELGAWKATAGME